MASRTVLLLIAHGSREPRANRELLDLADRLRNKRIVGEVVPCFLEIEAPDIPTAFDLAVRRGADEVVAFPYFLSTGAHVQTDIPAILAECARRNPAVKVSLARALGPGAELDSIVEKRIREGGAPVEPAEDEGGDAGS